MTPDPHTVNVTDDDGCGDFMFRYNGTRLTMWDGSTTQTSKTVVISGHTVELQIGDTACNNSGNVSNCWVRLINRDSNLGMANASVNVLTCLGCNSDEFFKNVDFMAPGNTTHSVIGGDDGNLGTMNPISGAGYSYVEDGNYKTAWSPFNVYGARVNYAGPGSSKKPVQILHPRAGQISALWAMQVYPGDQFDFTVTLRVDGSGNHYGTCGLSGKKMGAVFPLPVVRD
jgi:hypothetical protein